MIKPTQRSVTARERMKMFWRCWRSFLSVRRAASRRRLASTIRTANTQEQSLKKKF